MGQRAHPGGIFKAALSAETLDRKAVCVLTTAKSRADSALRDGSDNRWTRKQLGDRKDELPSRIGGGASLSSGSGATWLWAKRFAFRYNRTNPTKRP